MSSTVHKCHSSLEKGESSKEQHPAPKRKKGLSWDLKVRCDQGRKGRAEGRGKTKQYNKDSCIGWEVENLYSFFRFLTLRVIFSLLGKMYNNMKTHVEQPL